MKFNKYRLDNSLRVIIILDRMAIITAIGAATNSGLRRKTIILSRTPMLPGIKMEANPIKKDAVNAKMKVGILLQGR
jgi:hypothetical protein